MRCDEQAGQLSPDEREITQLKPLQVEEAEKYDARAYEPGMVVQFSQNVPGFKRGSRVEVEGRTPYDRVLVKGQDGPKELPHEKARHFELYNEHTVNLAPGDKVKITRNGKTKDGKHRPENRSIYTLKGFTDDGDLTLKDNGWVLDKDFGHVSYGHCLTSVNAQSKDDDALFLAHSRHSLGAGSLNQALVSLTRGKKAVHVYTDDKDALHEQVKDRADRKSALELLGDSTPAEDPAQRALQFGLLINRLKAHERNAVIRRMATHVTPPRHQVPMGSYRAAWMRERALADDRNPNDTPKKGLQRHGLDLPQPPTRKETLAAMQENSSEALAMTAPMLEFRFRNGDSIALAYSYMLYVERKLSEGIVITYASCKATIRGHRLDHVYYSIVSHNALVVQESQPHTIHSNTPNDDQYKAHSIHVSFQ